MKKLCSESAHGRDDKRGWSVVISVKVTDANIAEIIEEAEKKKWMIDECH